MDDLKRPNHLEISRVIYADNQQQHHQQPEKKR